MILMEKIAKIPTTLKATTGCHVNYSEFGALEVEDR